MCKVQPAWQLVRTSDRHRFSGKRSPKPETPEWHRSVSDTDRISVYNPDPYKGNLRARKTGMTRNEARPSGRGPPSSKAFPCSFQRRGNVLLSASRPDESHKSVPKTKLSRGNAGVCFTSTYHDGRWNAARRFIFLSLLVLVFIYRPALLLQQTNEDVTMSLKANKHLQRFLAVSALPSSGGETAQDAPSIKPESIAA